jgi:hypothetical protein
MYRKIIIAVDCEDDKQKEEVQAVANELSRMGLFQGDKILGAYPYFVKNGGDIKKLFSLVSQGGVKSLMSAQGISVISRLAKK